MDTERLSGGCLCGAVRFQVSVPPYRVGVFHCLDCRKTHGAVFRTFAIYPAMAVTLTGETARYAHEDKARRHFCPRCGGPVLAEDGGDEVEVFVGASDGHRPPRARLSRGGLSRCSTTAPGSGAR